MFWTIWITEKLSFSFPNRHSLPLKTEKTLQKRFEYLLFFLWHWCNNCQNVSSAHWICYIFTKSAHFTRFANRRNSKPRYIVSIFYNLTLDFFENFIHVILCKYGSMLLWDKTPKFQDLKRAGIRTLFQIFWSLLLSVLVWITRFGSRGPAGLTSVGRWLELLQAGDSQHQQSLQQIYHRRQLSSAPTFGASLGKFM